MITFGRYSDSFKPKNKVEAWNECEKLFEEKKFTESYLSFFNYIKDDKQDNVSFTQEDGRIKFELMQGSKVVKGEIDDKRITAESEVAAFDKLSLAVMRRILEMNFQLYYTRFALKDNLICIKFDSSIEDGLPRKLYYALKELATRADKQDDLLLDDFTVLKPITSPYVEPIPEAEKEVKYKYFTKWLGGTLKRVSELKEDSMSGGISYLLLNTLYKIDFLISPEGTLMNEIEKISWEYFAKDGKPFQEKNRQMKESLQKLLDTPKDKIVEDFYRVKSTFGIANPAGHQAVQDAFNNNLGNVKWYLDNKYEDIGYAIYEYTAGYCMFSYGLAKPTVRLFQLVYNILEQDYFTELAAGEKLYADQKFDEVKIKEMIDAIIKEGQEQFPQLAFKTEELKFSSLADFLKSYFMEMHGLNYDA